MAITFEEIKELEKQLRNLLPQLKAGAIHAIEYGVATEPSGVYSAYRIYYFMTAGGMQYRLSEVILFRGESTRGYYQDTDEGIEQIITRAIDRSIYYNRDTGLLEELNKRRRSNVNIKRPELSWFGVPLIIVHPLRQHTEYDHIELEREYSCSYPTAVPEQKTS